MAINKGINKESGVPVFRTLNQVINMIEVREKKLANLQLRSERTLAIERQIKSFQDDLAYLRQERTVKEAQQAAMERETRELEA